MAILHRFNGMRHRTWVGAVFLWVLVMLVTPRLPWSPQDHLFADKRNFFGVPNTLNVITNFPFLLVGVLGFVVCLHGNYFEISLSGELWGWVLFYASITAVAFGSAYYHLKPDDMRAIWDKLPMMLALTSLLTIFIIERIDERIGLRCFLPLIMASLLGAAYERVCNDRRVCIIFHLIPVLVIPGMAWYYPPKYTHSRYWFYATGFYILARLEGASDRKVYSANNYILSGHSLQHILLVIVPVLLTAMLFSRSLRIERNS